MTNPPIDEVREAIELAKQNPVTMVWQKTLIEAAAAYCEMQWQPIETAPRDGTVIDIWAIPDPDIFKDGSTYTKMHLEKYFPRRFADCYFENYMWHGIHDFMTPTHWMPLPQSPK